LKEELEKIIKTEILLSTFDVGEFNAARNSTFYSHIDFDMMTEIL
jgi:hypothetical protein